MNLKKLRTAANITQEQLAVQSGVSQTMISAVERGQSQITLPKAKMLAAALGCSLEALLDDVYEIPEKKVAEG